MLDIVFTAEGGFEARLTLGEDGHESLSRPVLSLNRLLQHSRYVLTPIRNGVQVQRSNKVYHPWTLTLRFRDQIRNRDRWCVISGDVIPERVITPGLDWL